MPHSSTTVLSAGVDTLTCSTEWEGGVHSFISLAQGLQREDAAHGSKVSPFKRGSYRGAQTAHVGLAFAPGRVLAELRGVLAHEYWPHFIERASKVSRVDVEVSVRQKPYDHELALREWFAASEREKARGRPAEYRLQAQAAGGTTLYIGTGASRYQARMYERFYKTHLDEDRDVWRFEVQCRRERAQQVADQLLGVTDVAPLVQGAVYHHFCARGVVPIFDPSLAVRLSPLPKPTTDREKSLNWLASNVKPALRRHLGWGSYDQAVRALGIESRGDRL